MNGHDERGLILLLGVLPSAVSLLVMSIFQSTKAIAEKNKVKHFYCFLYITLALAGFLVLMIVVQHEEQGENFPQSGCQVVAVIIMLFLLSNLVVVVKAEMDNVKLQRFSNQQEAELADMVAGAFYDKEAIKQLLLQAAHAPNSSHNILTCIGHGYSQLGFIILNLVSLFKAMISGIWFYRSDTYPKFRVEPSQWQEKGLEEH
ncbi:hypothetical protein SUGI_1173540 [Cryptomeria japonica]|nr:hypothetical protein SUGI_1173540 [Cryptomeria japonica]